MTPDERKKLLKDKVVKKIEKNGKDKLAHDQKKLEKHLEKQKREAAAAEAEAVKAKAEAETAK